MSDGMGRELAYLSSHATNRYFIPNCGIFVPSITLSPANLDFWPIPNVEPQHDGDDETND